MGTSRPANFLPRRMSPLLVLVVSLSLLDTVCSHPQVSFGGSSSSSSGNTKPAGNDNNVDIADISTRWDGSSGGFQHGEAGCCCIRQHESCLSQLTAPDDLVGDGFIDQRIVNRPGSGSGSGSGSGLINCSSGEKLCCSSDPRRSSQCSGAGHSGSGGHSGGGHSGAWRQGCSESQVFGQKKCGERSYSRPASGIGHGESSPGEFPWTCLILNSNNDFVGTCAVVPENFNNDNSRGTAKVLTAAHNLNNVGSARGLKVRVGEYDASAYKRPEQYKHEEYNVVSAVTHPRFDPKRLSNDLAVLRLNQRVNLNHRYVNTACLPSCSDQFSYQFSNGSGVRCHVAGWGKDEFTGNFQFIQHKVDLPLVDDFSCNSALKRALNAKKPGVGDRFQLDSSEICAGGEIGKDACTGDGGSPLVCQAQSGRWTVVGLVSWGIGCASDLPGVYVDIAHYRDWINAN